MESNLTERQEKVIRQMYCEEKSLKDIAKELGVTKEKVRQIQTKAMTKLRAIALKKLGRKFFE